MARATYSYFHFYVMWVPLFFLLYLIVRDVDTIFVLFAGALWGLCAALWAYYFFAECD